MIKDCLDFHVVKKNVKLYPKIVLEFDFKLSVAFFLFSVWYYSFHWEWEQEIQIHLLSIQLLVFFL